MAIIRQLDKYRTLQGKRDGVIPNRVSQKIILPSVRRRVRKKIGSVTYSSSGQGISFWRLMVRVNDPEGLIWRLYLILFIQRFLKRGKYNLSANLNQIKCQRSVKNKSYNKETYIMFLTLTPEVDFLTWRRPQFPNLKNRNKSISYNCYKV